MAELLDIYDENKNHIGTEDRNIVHEKGLWHKTIHCWIVKDKKNIIFQRRASHLDDNPSKLYTTASGHLKAGETLDNAFRREISEEIGITVDNPKRLFEVIYKTDFITKSNKEFHDRVFCNIFFANYDAPLSSYNIQTDELDGIVEVGINDALDLFDGKVEKINGKSYLKEGKEFVLKNIELSKKDFLTNPNETCKEKYSYILKAILEKL